MKKIICVLCVCVMALSLASCGSKKTASVSTDGSASIQKVINALGEAFMEDAGANFAYNATGSGTGNCRLPPKRLQCPYLRNDYCFLNSKLQLRLRKRTSARCVPVPWHQYARKCLGDEMYEHMMAVSAMQKARE